MKYILLSLTLAFCMCACDRSGDAVETPTYYNYKGVKGEGNLRAIDFGNTMNMFIDTQSINREGDWASVWTISNFNGALLEKMKNEHNTLSMRTLETFNCREKTINSTEFRAFSEYWLGGAEVSSGKLTDGVTTVEKDSVAEVKLRILCKYPQSSTKAVAPAQELPTSAASPAESSATAPTPASAPAPTPAPAPAPVAAVDNSPFAPSFDCAKASAPHEKLVCSDRELSKLDVDLSQSYAKAKEKTADKDKLKKEQLEWIKFSLRACSDKTCLVGAYQQRISQLQ